MGPGGGRPHFAPAVGDDEWVAAAEALDGLDEGDEKS